MRTNEKQFLSKHKHVKMIVTNRLMAFPVMYEETFDWMREDETQSIHNIILLFGTGKIDKKIDAMLKGLSLKKRIDMLNPKIFVEYGSVLPVD